MIVILSIKDSYRGCYLRANESEWATDFSIMHFCDFDNFLEIP